MRAVLQAVHASHLTCVDPSCHASPWHGISTPTTVTILQAVHPAGQRAGGGARALGFQGLRQALLLDQGAPRCSDALMSHASGTLRLRGSQYLSSDTLHVMLATLRQVQSVPGHAVLPMCQFRRRMPLRPPSWRRLLRLMCPSPRFQWSHIHVIPQARRQIVLQMMCLHNRGMSDHE